MLGPIGCKISHVQYWPRSQSHIATAASSRPWRGLAPPRQHPHCSPCGQALNVDTEDKRNQETFSLKNSGDFFRKIVILDGNVKAWTDEDGIMYVGVIPFLLEEVSLNF